jgi:type II secretory pathway component GspD/PulD (secretin)
VSVVRLLASGLLLLACASLAPDPAAAETPAGRRGSVSLTIRDAPIAEVFEMLSRKDRVNVLIGKGVEGNVSVNLFEVSIDEAIRSIADAAGYVAERRPGGYVIIDREEAGQDSAYGNTVIQTFKIEYSDPTVVSGVIQKHLSRYGEITELVDRKLLVVEDLPEFVARIERLLAELDRDPRQILIEAKILEILLNEDEDFGIDWTGFFEVEDAAASVGVQDLARKLSPGLFFDLMSSDIEIAVNALADKGRVRTLSTPTLLALEYEEAEVVVGDRLGFRTTTTVNQVTTESVEFLESGVILRFLASVDEQERIVLKIHPEVSTGTISDGLPSQTTTEVTTRLVSEDGQRIFIGGLIKNKESRARIGVPYLMEIPILGWLFRREEKVYSNTETIVILTAHLVDRSTPPMSAAKAKRMRESEAVLEEREETMRNYFGPASFDADADEAADAPPDQGSDAPGDETTP